MINPEQTLTIQQRLERADQRELRQAAEAVVDAAIWRRKLQSTLIGAGTDVSEETRSSLIELVFQDPSLTAFLFEDAAWERH